MSNGYKKQFYKLFLKKTVRDVPKIFGVLFLMLVLSGAAFLGINLFLAEEDNQIKVCYVYEDEELWFRAGIKYLGRSINCDFKKVDEDEAMDLLEDGEVVAAVYIEDEEGEVLNSNFPISSIRFVHYGKKDFINRIFDEIIEAGMTDFLVLNVDRDIAEASFEDFNSSDMSNLEEKLLKFLMHRNRTYDRVSFYDSGDSPMIPHYTGCAISLMFLLGSAVTLGFGKNDENRFVAFARSKGIKKRTVFFAKYLPVSCFFLLLTVVGIVSYELIYFEKVMALGIVSGVIATLLGLSQIILIHELVTDKNISSVVAVFYIFLVSFISGNIVPEAFLPKGVNAVGQFMPVRFVARLYSQTIYGQAHVNTIIYGLVALAFMFIIILVCELFGGKSYERG